LPKILVVHGPGIRTSIEI